MAKPPAASHIEPPYARQRAAARLVAEYSWSGDLGGGRVTLFYVPTGLASVFEEPPGSSAGTTPGQLPITAVNYPHSCRERNASRHER